MPTRPFLLLNRWAIPIINKNDTVSIAELKLVTMIPWVRRLQPWFQRIFWYFNRCDGLYTANPSQDPTAKRLDRIEHISREMIEMAGGAGSSNGTGGMLTKLKAATLATESGVPVYICSSLKSDALLEAAQEQADGSYFLAEDKGLKPRSNGSLYAESKGAVWVDAGAAEALLDLGRVIDFWCDQGRRDFLITTSSASIIKRLVNYWKRQGPSRPISCARSTPI